MFGRVERIEYQHVDDPEDVRRVHVFGRGVNIIAEEDGTVRLEHARGRRLWDDFPEEPG